MATAASKSITFLVPGQAETNAVPQARAAATAPPADSRPGRVKLSVRVGSRRGTGSDEVRVTAVPGEDVVVLHLAGGPSLTLHPETARDLMLAQGEVKRSRGMRDGKQGEGAPAEVRVPARLRWRRVSRCRCPALRRSAG